MIADYFVSKEHVFLRRDWTPNGWPHAYPGNPWVSPDTTYTTFQNDWPEHYNWAKENIFGDVEF